ncbi:Uncharacterized protein APZ42_010724 [Daphnia magna]|uniref:Uncharacterized protein n=1 Tax=Daphnia magna TaxID=35525 RepID=A0A164D8Z6_9CRUS|nr:Uncharacterized protein APZ42_010724 [Daphnia magna]
MELRTPMHSSSSSEYSSSVLESNKCSTAYWVVNKYRIILSVAISPINNEIMCPTLFTKL